MPHEQYQACIDACTRCAQACRHCAASCLQEHDVQKMTECIRLDLDCAGICELSVAYMSRGSKQSRELCALCAQICERCAEECARHQAQHCQQCAQACRDCAQACRQMAAA
ncbi:MULTISPECIES: four-helix bundle copper-binding protein [Cupriavidus]|uniref:four-helix bundle copper-binding protein n=1 Tax=Cupriavidus TaxID=106589 RepID=UPI00029103B9|nr:MULTISPECIES: four-helix bundle copper-binding protein [Cupriavidus]ESJ12850.1 ferredoxin [Cupriavidus sp. HPC(L)]MCD9121812.1 four-helix bundle copper-binding protein [Cupriavidus sp. UGS-1]